MSSLRAETTACVVVYIDVVRFQNRARDGPPVYLVPMHVFSKPTCIDQRSTTCVRALGTFARLNLFSLLL